MSEVGVSALLNSFIFFIYSLISSFIMIFISRIIYSFVFVSHSVDVCRTFIVVSTPAVCNEGTANRLYPGSESGQRKPRTKTHRWRTRGEIKHWILGGHNNLVLNNCYEIIRAPNIFKRISKQNYCALNQISTTFSLRGSINNWSAWAITYPCPEFNAGLLYFSW